MDSVVTVVGGYGGYGGSVDFIKPHTSRCLGNATTVEQKSFTPGVARSQKQTLLAVVFLCLFYQCQAKYMTLDIHGKTYIKRREELISEYKYTKFLPKMQIVFFKNLSPMP